MIITALAGIPIGLLMVTFVPTNIVTGILGSALVVYGAYSLSHRRMTSDDTQGRLRHPLWGLLFGFASGVFGSAFNFTGVPVAIYGSFRQWEPQNFRSTMQAYFLIVGPLIVAAQGMSKMWTSYMFTLYLFSLPALALAILAGTKLHKNIPTAKFQHYVFLMIAALGAVLVVKSTI